MRRLLLVTSSLWAFSTAHAQTGDTIYYQTPEWSPDGKKIVFTSGRDGESAIYTIDVDGNNLTQVTDGENNDEWPVWSPNGERIAFFSNRRKFRDEGEFGLQILTINVDGTDEMQLTPAGPNLDYAVSWSPDGTQLVFQSRPDINPGVHSLYTIGSDGRGRTRLTDGRYNDHSPQWSPNGDHVVFVQTPALYNLYSDQTPEERSAARASSEIMVLNIKDWAITPVTNNNLREEDPSWSADGNEVYYLRFSDNGEKTFVRHKLGEPDGMAIADGDLVANDRRPYNTRVSPDGRYLVYHKHVDGKYGVYIYDLEQEQERRLIGETAD